MTEDAVRKASILVYRAVGGGAEKIVMGIARLLRQRGQLEKLYVGMAPSPDVNASMSVVSLDSARALGAIPALFRAIPGDHAETYLLTANYLALAPVLRLRKPSARIIIRVASIVSVEMRDRGLLSRLRYSAGTGLALACATEVIAQGEDMRRDLIGAFPFAERKIVVIRNFIEEAVWNHRPTPVADYPYIFCAATFRPVKAFDTMLAAFSKSSARKERKLVIGGIDPDDRDFSALMERFGLSQNEVIRLGFVEPPYDWIAGADLCVLTSRYEGFSNFLLEAAAFGKRIVSTDCPGGNRELLALYTNATTVPVDDVDALASALAEPRQDMPRAEARRFLAPFEWDRISADYLRTLFPEGPD